jgi:hypothetical protein
MEGDQERRRRMISGILFASAGQIRNVLAEGDHIVEEELARGQVIETDPVERAAIDRLVQEMERLAHQLWTGTVTPLGPF